MGLLCVMWRLWGGRLAFFSGWGRGLDLFVVVVGSVGSVGVGGAGVCSVGVALALLVLVLVPVLALVSVGYRMGYHYWC